MNPRQIESWALRALDAVARTQTNEDLRVELKARWPLDFAKTARQIAGQANAAGDEPVLWLIGVDEAQGVVDFPALEFSDWYNQLARQFDALPPRMTPLGIPYGDKRPVALLIETDRAPFVVKNPAHNAQGGGPVQWETPWREGNAVRSARRADILRLFSPAQWCPDVEVVDAGASCWAFSGAGDEVSSGLYWSIELQLFVVPRGDTPLVMPFHRSTASMTLIGHFWEYPFDALEIWPAGRGSSMLECDGYQATMRGASMLQLRAQTYHPDRAAWYNFSDLALRVQLAALHLETPLVLDVGLLRGDRGPVPLPGDLDGLRSYRTIYALRR